MKLITEQIEDVKILTEEKDGKKLLYIEGVFLQSELKNRNGRMYPFEVLSREVERYTEEYVKPKRALGELGHPDGPTINLDRVLTWPEESIYGYVTLDTNNYVIWECQVDVTV